LTGRSLEQRSPTECVYVSLSVIRRNNNLLHQQCIYKEVRLRKKGRTVCKIGKVVRELFATFWDVLEDEFSNTIVSLSVKILRVAVSVYTVAHRLLATILIFLL
jgi:hypothetical protein